MRRAFWLSVVGLITATLTVFAAPSASAETSLAGVAQRSDAGAAAFVTFRVLHSRQCLDIFDASLAPGANAIQWPCNGDANQLFEAIPAPNGTFIFRARHSSQCLDVFDASQAQGTKVIQWPCNADNNQRFRLHNAGGGTVLVQAVHSGQCLDILFGSVNPGTWAIQWPCHGGASQRWF